MKIAGVHALDAVEEHLGEGAGPAIFRGGMGGGIRRGWRPIPRQAVVVDTHLVTPRDQCADRKIPGRILPRQAGSIPFERA